MVLAGTGGGKEELKSQLESDLLRVEIGEDIIGVQVGSSLKNVINILIGIAEGVGYGQNTQAFIFTKGVQEIKNFGVALGAKEETFLGLTCIGDLTLHSRNRFLGVRLGKGEKLDDIIKDMNHTPEGIYAIKNGRSIAKARSIQVPIIDKIHSIIFEGKKIEDVLNDIR
jgi:glycerol-3-phosphate dehydrogenase (NAD(P)+)